MPEVQSVLGPVPAGELGIVLPHEHLFNDLSSLAAAPAYPSTRVLVDQRVGPRWQHLLRQDPYCCRDNVRAKEPERVEGEVDAFRAVGGRTVVDATGSPAIGRDPVRLRRLAEATSTHIVMGTGAYLETFEGTRITARAVDQQTESILADLDHGVDDTGVRAGVIGEVGVSPLYTRAESASLRAAAIAQVERPTVGLNIHLPGWQRRGHEVLDLVLAECGVAPGKVALAHSDPSGADPAYQRSLLDRGVRLEFDMIGLDITFPGEGAAPSVVQTADAVTDLVRDGFGSQLLLSHDLFLKQMWIANGGNGLVFVPTIFRDLLRSRGLAEDILDSLLVANPAEWLTGGPS
ncbi:phosphotriesterase family protein [Leekyejoonella antrihumi]|uniref:Phosphotriesterase n=1 Tax=Leekyejoonella antrihumi TaxID=1660198 RepID=A0A563DSG8_9MICO|nr:phosphotriesterase [Leekyejoonella antrihumi]TWP33175.1 phosphotriesterase [Leekyejoonella antrihumi]